MTSPRSFRVKALLVALFLFANAVYLARNAHSKFSFFKKLDLSAGNSTLGFESILVVSPKIIPPGLRWRKDGLLKAAAYTGIDMEVPQQPAWTTKDTWQLMSKNPDLKKGYALSILGHLNALKIAATRTTSLIVEDDVDWDVGLRSQMPRIAEAVRNLTGYSAPLHDNGSTAQAYPPYGMEWDVLWLGHCGESIVFDPTPVTLDDPTVPPYYNSWEKIISPDPHHTRYIHQSAGPICTYAYVVTKATALKILNREDAGTNAYDIWLHIMCKGRELRCISVNPELFHHHELAGEKITLINGHMGESVENEMTDNIWHSARCNSVSKSDKLVTCMGPEPKIEEPILEGLKPDE
ncbi:glycosyltransferase family 25 protein [Lepidopterella palustris CBS 459.81]|uniref:Glycosyltransferase family 25 protein n=1 Tax=Lepidopterella palustris CBS 459.81 TaxID=1314670 RepID=A0A8E2JC07_9PEZI|nr:glycosyltransferase family 25 protein [Lepidopterella palustris CBS 459.81]